MFINQLNFTALYLWEEDNLWENSTEYLVLNNPCSLPIVSVKEKSHKFSKNSLIIKKPLNRTQADNRKKNKKPNRKTLLKTQIYQKWKKKTKSPKPFWIECSHHNGPLIAIFCWMLGRLLTSLWEFIEIRQKLISNQISHPLFRTFFWLYQEGCCTVTLKQSSTNCMPL